MFPLFGFSRDHDIAELKGFFLPSWTLVQTEVFIYLILKVFLLWSCFNLAEFVVEWLMMNPRKKPKSSRKIFQTKKNSITTVSVLFRNMLSPCCRFQLQFKLKGIPWHKTENCFNKHDAHSCSLPWLSLLDPWNTFYIGLGVLTRIQSNKVNSLLNTGLDAEGKSE